MSENLSMQNILYRKKKITLGQFIVTPILFFEYGMA